MVGSATGGVRAIVLFLASLEWLVTAELLIFVNSCADDISDVVCMPNRRSSRVTQERPEDTMERGWMPRPPGWKDSDEFEKRKSFVAKGMAISRVMEAAMGVHRRSPAALACFRISTWKKGAM